MRMVMLGLRRWEAMRFVAHAHAGINAGAKKQKRAEKAITMLTNIPPVVGTKPAS